jgi:hypothetical protein
MNVIQEAEVASLAALIGTFTGFRLGIVAERRNQRRKSQLEFVPFIKRLISDIERTNPSVTWWNINRKVQDNVWEFSMHLGWFKRRAFESAWNECKVIKPTDLFPNNEPGFVSKGPSGDIQEAQQKLLRPLSKLLKIAEGA